MPRHGESEGSCLPEAGPSAGLPNPCKSMTSKGLGSRSDRTSFKPCSKLSQSWSQCGAGRQLEVLTNVTPGAERLPQHVRRDQQVAQQDAKAGSNHEGIGVGLLRGSVHVASAGAPAGNTERVGGRAVSDMATGPGEQCLGRAHGGHTLPPASASRHMVEAPR